MAHKTVIDAVEGRLAERWSSPDAVAARQAAGLPALPFFGANTPENAEVPQDGSAYLEIQYPYSETVQATLGRVYRESGGFAIFVNFERGGGAEKASILADQLATLFRDRRFGGIQTFSPSSPVIDDRNEEGLYYSLSIAVPYEYVFRDDNSGGFYD
ncbi:phage tail terminator-like protein [Methylobacterium aquaticum]|uniref:phage tail terminator-like protein n=1 Tax=Methylobacterium aquaticum TaxID=270351 RepID=UPI001933302E|nr:phage tail terminator-like protein [Methylobacterium aquaticum]QRE77347.1 hypothetical protein F1D61_30895 [Methylobacterium aquaticum]